MATSSERAHDQRAPRSSQLEHDNDEGFTLIEILLVIVVLGILAAVVVFSIGNVASSGAQSACAADARSVEIAVQNYNIQVQPSIGLESSLGATTQQGLLVGRNFVTWPSNNPHYRLTLAYAGNSVGATAGQVLVYAPSSSVTPVVFDAQSSSNGCNTAGI